MESASGDNPTDPPAVDATRVLQRVTAGEDGAVDELLPLVYAELRARAQAYFRGQPVNHTLQPTALVHEAFLKLIRHAGDGWDSKAHFCAVAATAMRQILTDHARRRVLAHDARGGHLATAISSPTASATLDVLALDEALQRMAELNARHARIVELRFFGGMTIEEIAGVLGVSVSTTEKEWRRVRAWLLKELRTDSVK